MSPVIPALAAAKKGAAARHQTPAVAKKAARRHRL